MVRIAYGKTAAAATAVLGCCASVSAAGPSGAPSVKPKETFMDSLVRKGLVNILGWSHEKVDLSRAQATIRSHPVFHPRIERISEQRGKLSIDDILGFGPAGVDEDQSVFATGSTPAAGEGATTHPWAILISASRTDKDSQAMDQAFNRTIHAFYPDPSSGYLEIIEEDEPGTAEEEEEADDGLPYEIVGGFKIPKAPKPEKKRAPRSPESADRRAQAMMEGTEVLTKREKARRVKSIDSLRKNVDGWRFGYVDYFTEAGVSWKWWTWKAPMLVIATPSTSPERTYDLRFYKLAFAKPTTDQLISFIGEPTRWQGLPVWESGLAPGGSKHKYVVFISKIFHFFYPLFEAVPSWLLTIIAAGFVGLIPGFLHSDKAKTTPPPSAAKKQTQRVIAGKAK